MSESEERKLLTSAQVESLRRLWGVGTPNVYVTSQRVGLRFLAHGVVREVWCGTGAEAIPSDLYLFPEGVEAELRAFARAVWHKETLPVPAQLDLISLYRQCLYTVAGVLSEDDGEAADAEAAEVDPTAEEIREKLQAVYDDVGRQMLVAAMFASRAYTRSLTDESWVGDDPLVDATFERESLAKMPLREFWSVSAETRQAIETARGLRFDGVHSVRDLLMFHPDELLSVPGVEEAAVRELEMALSRYGLTFYPDTKRQTVRRWLAQPVLDADVRQLPDGVRHLDVVEGSAAADS